MTDKETIDRVTARLRGDIVICTRQDLSEVHVTVGEEVTAFSAAHGSTWERALQLARAFAKARRLGTTRQIQERFLDNFLDLH